MRSIIYNHNKQMIHLTVITLSAPTVIIKPSISIKDFVREKKSATEKRKSNRNFLIFINEIEHQTS
jgi:hypothetical protein